MKKQIPSVIFRYRSDMKYLSYKEYEFLKHPEKFEKNYRYVLTHRIKNKKDDLENVLSVINKHERALLTDKERIEYDEEKAIEHKLKEHNKKYKVSPSFFIPNIEARARSIQTKIHQLESSIDSFKYVIEKSTITPTTKEQALEFINYLKKDIDKSIDELKNIFTKDEKLIEK